MATFVERLEGNAPEDNNLFYIMDDYDGYNRCVAGSNGPPSVLPNCVGYAWGRAYEIMVAVNATTIGKPPTLSINNAERWWQNDATDDYVRSQEPRIASIMCWKQGEDNTGSDGAGHVAVVEQIEGNIIRTSESGWGSARFKNREFTKGNYALGGTYEFQGFIYLPGDYSDDSGGNIGPEKPGIENPGIPLVPPLGEIKAPFDLSKEKAFNFVDIANRTIWDSPVAIGNGKGKKAWIGSLIQILLLDIKEGDTIPVWSENTNAIGKINSIFNLIKNI